MTGMAPAVLRYAKKFNGCLIHAARRVLLVCCSAIIDGLAIRGWFSLRLATSTAGMKARARRRRFSRLHHPTATAPMAPVSPPTTIKAMAHGRRLSDSEEGEADAVRRETFLVRTLDR